MKNLAKSDTYSIKGYFIFVLATLMIGLFSAISLIFFTIKGNQESHKYILAKESINIKKTITESFNYSNKINSYLGEQIVEHGADDLEFILRIFRRADKIQNKNSQLLSWSSFDWVSPDNLQLVNSKIGIRKNPPDMSVRQYCQRSPQKPWTLQVSFPVLGNPSKSWVIPAGTGITAKDGKYLGTVVVGFNIAEFSSMVQQRLSDKISFVVLDENLNIVMKSQDNELSSGDSFFKIHLDKSALNKKFGNLEETIKVGNIHYSYYHKFSDYPYFVIAGFNDVFFNKEFNNSILPIIVGFVSITSFFLIILYVFRNKILILIERERKLRNSLHNTNKSKTKLIRAASHDLKNYIFGISGLAKLILQDKKQSEIKVNEDLKIIREISTQSEELMGFVEDLLDTQQNQEGEFSLKQLELCNIVEMTKRMVILNQNFAMENSISLKLDNEKQKPIYIKCDIRRIKQIINNLISNAIKYSSANTKVVLSVYEVGKKNQICFEIKDSGIGMTKDEIKMALIGDGEKIDKSNLNKTIDSHGIGMPIIKKLVELHHGKLEINSKKGFGTTVKIYFKKEVTNKSKSEISDTSILSINSLNKLKNKSVLLAEDNPVSNKISTFLLRKLGFMVKHVENGKQLLDELDKSHFDLIFMDINMPDLNGYEAANIIRKGESFKNFKNKNIPIIAISAEEVEESKLKHYNINGFLNKPFTEQDLLNFVVQYV